MYNVMQVIELLQKILYYRGVEGNEDRLREKMRNKKLYIFIFAILVTSAALAPLYSRSYSGGVVETVAEDWSDDVSLIAFKASEYWRTPSVMGGGSDSFLKLERVETLGLNERVLSAEYEITSIRETEFTLLSREIIPGSIVKTTITYDGIATLPIIIKI